MDKALSEKIKAVSFLAIIMVVFLHAYNLDTNQEGTFVVFGNSLNWVIQDYISYGLTRIAVPVFFIISGFLFFRGKPLTLEVYLEKIKKRFRSLLLPFLFWSFFGIGIYLILQAIPFLTSFFSKDLVINYSFSQLIDTIFINPIPYQLWFIRDLMLLIVISPILNWMLIKIKFIPLIIIAIFWFMHIEGYNNSIEALLFFYVGGYFGRFQESALNVKHTDISRFILLLWLMTLGFKTGLKYFECDIFIVNIFFKLSIIFGIVAFWNLIDTIKDNAFFDLFRKHFDKTFFIYAFHEPLLTMVKKGAFFLLNEKPESYLLVYFLAPVLTIFLAILTALFLKRNLPFWYTIATGNR